MTNLGVFNEIGETELSAEDTALGMILTEFEQNLVRDFTLGLYMENNDNCNRYIERYHYMVKWLSQEKEDKNREVDKNVSTGNKN